MDGVYEVVLTGIGIELGTNLSVSLGLSEDYLRGILPHAILLPRQKFRTARYNRLRDREEIRQRNETKEGQRKAGRYPVPCIPSLKACKFLLSVRGQGRAFSARIVSQFWWLDCIR